MCCLKYEDQTYRELKKNLPHKKSRVGTLEGPGIIIEGKILTQLVLVELEHDKRRIAVPVEELLDPETCPRPWEEVEIPKDPKAKKKRNRRKKSSSNSVEDIQPSGEGAKKKKRRRKRRRKRKNNNNSDKT
tara:strand:- start:316 stop:708 length:393 start_codon:yes stop_codon:yes gene_type:complete